ncbi:hypothetical protein [Wolbachia endosymbiont (group A) of Agelastica alni]|uniref:hypothetical protein n=1 Tax=Wolbachia endosymbiont (group A) of Agelastica alni TaxID=3066130 RepID=UPI003132B075
MNNKNRSKDRRKEIEHRILQSGRVFDNEAIEILLYAVHDETQAQVIAKRLTDSFKGIGRILAQEMDDLKTVEWVTDLYVKNKFINITKW